MSSLSHKSQNGATVEVLVVLVSVPFLGNLLSHLNSSHRNSVDFRQKCGLPRCKSNSEYTSTNSFVKHVRANHREIISSTYEAVFGVSQDLVDDQENATGNTFWFLILIRLSHAIM